MTDAEFDELEDTLREINQAHPYFNTVGAPPTSDRPKISHAVPMLSLAKVKVSAYHHGIIANTSSHPLNDSYPILDPYL